MQKLEYKEKNIIKFVKGDLLKARVDALVNAVNIVGVMGKGIALQFKHKFPQNYAAYRRACFNNEVKIGKMFIFRTNLEKPKYIINFPTKRHWKDKSKIEDIKIGLEDLVDVVRKLKISSIAIPPLGCGCGGLDWNDVKVYIESAFKDVPNVLVVIYEPLSIYGANCDGEQTR